MFGDDPVPDAAHMPVVFDKAEQCRTALVWKDRIRRLMPAEREKEH
jgi:hypothetical protein